MVKVHEGSVTVKVRTDGPATVTVRVKAGQDRAITVTLPDVASVPRELWGTPYTLTRLLTKGGDNPKLAKSDAAGTAYRTWGLTLAPARQSGYQVCPSASAGCRRACLFQQGQARVFGTINVARVAKTVAFFTQRRPFLAMLRRELDAVVRLARREEFTPAVRLNVMSDLPWERLAPWLFTRYPQVQFYDYTKHVRRVLGRLPANYHLTFSRSETNGEDCLRVLKAGGNVAVVFSGRDLPPTWNGYRVINGDETDLRFLDPRGVVVGLYAKGTAAKDESGFVVPARGVMSLAVVN
jgi:hypothetical protein